MSWKAQTVCVALANELYFMNHIPKTHAELTTLEVDDYHTDWKPLLNLLALHATSNLRIVRLPGVGPTFLNMIDRRSFALLAFDAERTIGVNPFPPIREPLKLGVYKFNVTHLDLRNLHNTQPASALVSMLWQSAPQIVTCHIGFAPNQQPNRVGGDSLSSPPDCFPLLRSLVFEVRASMRVMYLMPLLTLALQCNLC